MRGSARSSFVGAAIANQQRRIALSEADGETERLRAEVARLRALLTQNGIAY